MPRLSTSRYQSTRELAVGTTRETVCGLKILRTVIKNTNFIIHARYLYTLFLALDACFRLKRRMISSVEKDPGLGVDWGYFVESAPFRQYLLSVTDQKEVIHSDWWNRL